MQGKTNWNPYIGMVDFIGKCFGDNVEVVLHDLTDPQHSVIAICNGHITGRSIGSPLTENSKISGFFIEKITKEPDNGTKSIMNYSATTHTGKPLRCSSMFIYDEEGKPAGALCVNIDISEYKRAEEIIAKLSLVNQFEAKETEAAWVQNHPVSMSTMVTIALEEVLADRPVDIDRLTAEEKLDIVKQLKEKDLFKIRGTVSEVANRLLTSESTIYRYLRNADRETL